VVAGEREQREGSVHVRKMDTGREYPLSLADLRAAGFPAEADA
jgi:hypothetical protein